MLITALSMLGTRFRRVRITLLIWAGVGVSDRVGNVHCRGSGGNRLLDHLAQEIGLRPNGVFRREFDVGTVADGPLHTGNRPLDDVVLAHLQLVFAVDGAGGQEDVDARLFGMAKRFPGPVDIGVAAAGQTADHRAVDPFCNLAHSLEVARRRDGEPGLDHIDAQLD